MSNTLRISLDNLKLFNSNKPHSPHHQQPSDDGPPSIMNNAVSTIDNQTPPEVQYNIVRHKALRDAVASDNLEHVISLRRNGAPLSHESSQDLPEKDFVNLLDQTRLGKKRSSSNDLRNSLMYKVLKEIVVEDKDLKDNDDSILHLRYLMQNSTLSHEDLELAKYIVNKHSNKPMELVSPGEGSNWSVLHLAALNSHMEVFHLMIQTLDRSAVFYQEDIWNALSDPEDGWNPLHVIVAKRAWAKETKEDNNNNNLLSGTYWCSIWKYMLSGKTTNPLHPLRDKLLWRMFETQTSAKDICRLFFDRHYVDNDVNCYDGYLWDHTNETKAVEAKIFFIKEKPGRRIQITIVYAGTTTSIFSKKFEYVDNSAGGGVLREVTKDKSTAGDVMIWREVPSFFAHCQPTVYPMTCCGRLEMPVGYDDMMFQGSKVVRGKDWRVSYDAQNEGKEKGKVVGFYKGTPGLHDALQNEGKEVGWFCVQWEHKPENPNPECYLYRYGVTENKTLIREIAISDETVFPPLPETGPGVGTLVRHKTKDLIGCVLSFPVNAEASTSDCFLVKWLRKTSQGMTSKHKKEKNENSMEIMRHEDVDVILTDQTVSILSCSFAGFRYEECKLKFDEEQRKVDDFEKIVLEKNVNSTKLTRNYCPFMNKLSQRNTGGKLKNNRSPEK
eukprot:PhF_6_TR44299/c0_g1_i3/m.68318